MDDMSIDGCNNDPHSDILDLTGVTDPFSLGVEENLEIS